MRNFLINVGLDFFRPDTKNYYSELKKSEYASQDYLQHIQLIKLNNLVEHFCKIYPFYKELINKKTDFHSLSELDSLPVLTKQIISNNIDSISKFAGSSLIDSTSGSTGTNFTFYQSRESRCARSASINYVYEHIGVDYYNDRKVIIWGHSPGNWKKRIMQNFQRLLLNTKILDGYGIDDQICVKYLSFLNHWKPVLLQGYLHLVYQLSRAGLKYNILPPKIKKIILSGEQTFEHQKNLIEKYFNCDVFDRYGSREFSCIAHQCLEKSDLHVLPLRFIVEESHDGELLITDLDNMSTPFIRYKIGDGGKVNWKKCKCGRNTQVISNLQGRFNDVIFTPSGKILPSQFWTVLSRSSHIKGIREMQIVQDSISHVEMRIVSDSDFSHDTKASIIKAVKQLVGDELSVSISNVAHIDHTSAGKRKFIINNVKELHFE